jgi:hypothetical protein
MNATTSADARHLIANLLFTYAEIADRKDIATVTQLFGDAVVTFPSDGYDRRQDAEGFWTRLWGNDTVHRHDISNLVIEPLEGRRWQARAHYTRWVFQPDPVLHTLGEYELTVDIDTEGTVAQLAALTAKRTWTLG